MNDDSGSRTQGQDIQLLLLALNMRAAGHITTIQAAEALGFSPTQCAHQWTQYRQWNDASGEHGSKRCALCGKYVQW